MDASFSVFDAENVSNAYRHLWKPSVKKFDVRVAINYRRYRVFKPSVREGRSHLRPRPIPKRLRSPVLDAIRQYVARNTQSLLSSRVPNAMQNFGLATRRNRRDRLLRR